MFAASLAAALVVACGAPSARAADDPADAELAHQTLLVFQAKCADCHWPVKDKPLSKKGMRKIDYIMDLKQVAASKYIVAGKSDKSSLWDSIVNDEMPPNDAKCGPMSDAQKETVRKWIDVGAPLLPAGFAATDVTLLAPRPTSGPSSHAEARAQVDAKADAAMTGDSDDDKSKQSFGKRLLRLVGKFHPLLAHFPIALLVGAAVAELAWLKTKQPWLTGAVRFCTLFGAIGAIGAGGLGWIDAIYHTGGDAVHVPVLGEHSTLFVHRWLGTIAALWAIPVLLLSERGFRHRQSMPATIDEPRPWFQALLFVGVTLIGIAAHFGGDLVYGSDYLNF